MYRAGSRPLIAVLAAALFCACAGDSAGTARRPNIVLITLESIRTDHVSRHGYHRPTTPSLDALAEEAILFQNAYSVTSWTLPAHASIFTGLYPSAHRVVYTRDKLDDSHTTLAEHLGAAGYQTAGFVSGPWLQKQHNLHQGFEIYDESASNPDKDLSEAEVTNPEMEKRLTRFLEEGRDPGRPFFLFAYFWDPHYDYIPPEPYASTFVPDDAVPIDVTGYFKKGVVNRHISRQQLDYVISQYDGEILWTDELLGRLWDRLRALGLWENTAIIVTSDHGEEFFDHGTKGHKNNLYEESVRVPLVLKVSGTGPRVDERVSSLVDLYPTVLELAGVTGPDPHHGRSLLRPPDSGRSIYFELQSEWNFRDPATGRLEYVPNVFVAVRDGSSKLIVERNEGRRELYDLAADPSEKRPLEAGPEHALYHDLLTHFREMKDDASRWQQAGPAQLTPEQEERLRSLGYLGQPDSAPKKPAGDNDE